MSDHGKLPPRPWREDSPTHISNQTNLELGIKRNGSSRKSIPTGYTPTATAHSNKNNSLAHARASCWWLLNQMVGLLTLKLPAFPKLFLCSITYKRETNVELREENPKARQENLINHQFLRGSTLAP
jgi:hypothetical protein